MAPDSTPPLADGDLLAAVDLGSNSFHMVVAQMVLGQLRVVDRLRETVRMAEGLDGFGGLAPDVRDRALDCLSRFGQRVADLGDRGRAALIEDVDDFAFPRRQTGQHATHLMRYICSVLHL